MEVTQTSILQLAFAARTFAVKFVNRMKFVPATAVRVPPGQLSVGAGEAAITRPETRLSITVSPERAVSIGAVIVILKRLVEPGEIGFV